LFSRPLYERKMGQEFDGKILGEAFTGYVFRLTGGNDKQGFQMKQGIFSNTRVRILFRKRKYYILLNSLFFAKLNYNNPYRWHKLQANSYW